MMKTKVFAAAVFMAAAVNAGAQDYMRDWALPRTICATGPSSDVMRRRTRK